MARDQFSKPLPGEQHRTIGGPSKDAHLGPSLADGIATNQTAGGTINTNRDGTTLTTDGVSGERADVAIPTIPDSGNFGTIVAYWYLSLGADPDNINAEIQFGVGSNDSNSGENGARFSPHVGDNTTGNVELVDRLEVLPEGSVSYPSDTALGHYYALRINMDDQTTGFYIDRNPFLEEPQEKLDDDPGRTKEVFARITSTGSDSSDQITVKTMGYTYIP